MRELRVSLGTVWDATQRWLERIVFEPFNAVPAREAHALTRGFAYFNRISHCP